MRIICAPDSFKESLAADAAAAGLHDHLVIGEGLSVEESIARTAELLRTAAAKVARQWKMQGGN